MAVQSHQRTGGTKIIIIDVVLVPQKLVFSYCCFLFLFLLTLILCAWVNLVFQEASPDLVTKCTDKKYDSLICQFPNVHFLSVPVSCIFVWVFFHYCLSLLFVFFVLNNSLISSLFEIFTLNYKGITTKMISKTLFNQRLEWWMKLEKENQDSFYQKKKNLIKLI